MNEFKKMDKLENFYNKLKVECPNCKHKMVIPVFVDTQICNWCGMKLKNNTKEYFKYKMRKEIEKNEKRK